MDSDLFVNDLPRRGDRYRSRSNVADTNVYKAA
jgi:hypothetical protein